MNKFTTLLLCFFLSVSSLAKTLTAVVLKVYDGDTATVQIEGYDRKQKIRFQGIDSPEIDFQGFSQGPIAIEARDYLASLMPVGSTVTIDTGKVSRDKGNRILGTVYSNGINVNLEMLRSGLAAMYFIAPYSDSVVSEYREAMKEAYEEGIGMFSYDKQQVMIPYEFRMAVQERTGTNYVADLEYMTLHYPEDVSEVAPYNRVFFKYEDDANAKGFYFE